MMVLDGKNMVRNISKDTLSLGDIPSPSYLISYIGLSMNVMVKHLLQKLCSTIHIN
jgi:hypothetical protein